MKSNKERDDMADRQRTIYEGIENMGPCRIIPLPHVIERGSATLLFPKATRVTFEGDSDVIRQLIARLDKVEVEYTQASDWQVALPDTEHLSKVLGDPTL